MQPPRSTRSPRRHPHDGGDDDVPSDLLDQSSSHSRFARSAWHRIASRSSLIAVSWPNSARHSPAPRSRLLSSRLLSSRLLSSQWLTSPRWCFAPGSAWPECRRPVAETDWPMWWSCRSLRSFRMRSRRCSPWQPNSTPGWHRTGRRRNWPRGWTRDWIERWLLTRGLLLLRDIHHGATAVPGEKFAIARADAGPLAGETIAMTARARQMMPIDGFRAARSAGPKLQPRDYDAATARARKVSSARTTPVSRNARCLPSATARRTEARHAASSPSRAAIAT